MFTCLLKQRRLWRGSNTGSCLPSIITSLVELCIFEQ